MKPRIGVSPLLVNAFKFETHQIPDMVGICGVCGYEGGVLHQKRAITPTTSNIADLFRHGNGVCFECCACIQEPRVLISNLYADSSGMGLRPVVSAQSETEERPTWRNLIRHGLTEGAQTAAIFTSNVQRRLWHNAPVGTIGDRWRVLMVHDDIERVLVVNLTTLKDVLDKIEYLLNLGFSKVSIKDGLLSGNQKYVSQNINTAISLENQIAEYRNQDEFILTLFIAQGDPK